MHCKCPSTPRSPLCQTASASSPAGTLSMASPPISLDPIQPTMVSEGAGYISLHAEFPLMSMGVVGTECSLEKQSMGGEENTVFAYHSRPKPLPSYTSEANISGRRRRNEALDRHKIPEQLSFSGGNICGWQVPCIVTRENGL